MRMQRSGMIGIAAVLVTVALVQPVVAETKMGGTPSAPVRVATLLPFVEDALRRVDPARVRVVAAVRRTMMQVPGGDVVDLGSPHDPSLEQLAEVKPDLVVGDRALHGRFAGRLAEAELDVLLIDSTSVDGTLAGLGDIATRAGVADAMGRELAVARAALAGAASPRRTLLVFGTPESFTLMTAKTWLGDLVARVGLQNLVSEVGGSERHPGFVEVNDEALAGLDPELVLLVAHGAPEPVRQRFAERFETRGIWRRGAAPARIHVLPPTLFASNPGLGLGEAASELRRLAADPAVATR